MSIRVGMLIILFSFIVGVSGSHAAKLSFSNCSKTEKSEIKTAVKWLKNNIKKIDREMGKRGLMNWPGNSRKKFQKKLSKKLKFVCKTGRKMCEVKKDGRMTFGKVIPVFKGKTIYLCPKYFSNDKAQYASTIAHEIGHLIRLNGHRKPLCEKFKRPRFSESLGQAVQAAHSGKEYNASIEYKRCQNALE